MKIEIYILILLLLLALSVNAQDTTSKSSYGKDTLKYNNLRDDDPAYNKKYPLYYPLTGVIRSNISTWLLDRYILKEEWAKIGFNSIRKNLKSAWVWDTDNFYYNFLAHPYAGSMYFNSPRSEGYNFFESAPFVLFGSAMWEYFMENTPPSKNDLINTTLSGIFLGEVLYRISSNILDDRSTGSERFFRELFAGIINPTRGFNRLTQGKIFRHTPKEVYQKEPMNLTVSAGIHSLSEDLDFKKGKGSGLMNLEIVYGDPFENRHRKPFDYFDLNIGLNFFQSSLSKGSWNILDHITGNGIMVGKNSQHGRLDMLTGIYQNYDYWSTRHFEIGTLGLGGGLKFQIPYSKTLRFESSVNLNAVPFGANNSNYTAVGERNYNFAGGLEAKTANTLYLGIASISLSYYYYLLHTYVGERGNNMIGILIPKVTLKLFKKLGIGAEYLLYHKDSYLSDFPDVHTRNSEVRLYLIISSGYFGF